MKFFEKDVRQPIQLRILDIILLNPETMEPYKWVYTNNSGHLQFHTISNTSFFTIAKSLLTNISSHEINSELPQSRRIVIRKIIYSFRILFCINIMKLLALEHI